MRTMTQKTTILIKDEYDREWYATRPGYAAKHGKEWRAAHPGAASTNAKKWREDNPDAASIDSKRWRESNPDVVVRGNTFRHAHRRFLAYAVLGGRCERCGTNDPMVLEFNHRNGDGKQHRAEIGGSGRLISWVLNNPEEAVIRLELLCGSCHTKEHSIFHRIEGYTEVRRKVA